MAHMVGDDVNFAGHDGTIIVTSARGVKDAQLKTSAHNPQALEPISPEFFIKKKYAKVSKAAMQAIYGQSADNWLGSNRWSNQEIAETGFCGFEVLARALGIPNPRDEFEVAAAIINLNDDDMRQAFHAWNTERDWLDYQTLLKSLMLHVPAFTGGIYYIRTIVNCSMLRENCSAPARDCSAGRHERATAQAAHTALTARRVLLRVLAPAIQVRAGRFRLSDETGWPVAEMLSADNVVAGLKACNDPFVLYTTETMGNPDTNGNNGGRHFQFLRNKEYVQPQAGPAAEPAAEPAELHD